MSVADNRSNGDAPYRLDFPQGLSATASVFFVYRLYAGDGTLLYVGSTCNLLERLGAHARKPWAEKVVAVEVAAFTERSAALQAERKAVRQEKPRHNAVLYIIPDSLTPNQYRAVLAAHTREKVCEVCSEEFTATRAHAKTCSPACKQKGYRQRKESGRDVIG